MTNQYAGPESVLADLRTDYHRNNCCNILGFRAGTTVYSNADKDSPISVDLAARVAVSMSAGASCELCAKPPAGQGAGSRFASYTREFLERSFRRLTHVRPGSWHFNVSQAAPGIARYHQYAHLSELVQVLERHPDLKAALGGDYLITPDIVIARSSLTDAELNAAPGQEEQPFVHKDGLPFLTPLRRSAQPEERDLLHASISCKWTMRSDRAQNSRTEALNLIRNRKGSTPHIAVVIFEPLPARIASIAMGTGDIDCTYHPALFELLQAAKDGNHDDSLELLQTLVKGRRLRDISDLPFDLAV